MVAAVSADRSDLLGVFFTGSFLRLRGTELLLAKEGLGMAARGLDCPATVYQSLDRAAIWFRDSSDTFQEAVHPYRIGMANEMMSTKGACHLSHRVKGECDRCGMIPQVLHMPEFVHGWYCSRCCPVCNEAHEDESSQTEQFLPPPPDDPSLQHLGVR